MEISVFSHVRIKLKVQLLAWLQTLVLDSETFIHDFLDLTEKEEKEEKALNHGRILLPL